MRNALITLALLAVAAPAHADFLPIDSGNFWVYRSTQNQQLRTIRVAFAPIITNGKVYHKVSGYAAEDILIRVDENNSLYWLDLGEEREELLTSFVPSGSEWFPAPKRNCPQEGQAQPERVAYSGAAGSLDSVLSVKYRSFGCGDAGVFEEQYVDNIGMVRRTEQSFGGEVSYDLIYAQVGALTVAERPNTAFRLSLRPSANGNLLASLRLTSASSSPASLTFHSSQEFDVVVRNAAGESVWRWSAGQIFLYGMKTIVTGDLHREVEIPLVPNGQTLPPGEYVAEAWLTTGIDERRFAAESPFTIDQ